MSLSIFYHVRLKRAYVNVFLRLSRLYALYSERQNCGPRSQRLICGLTRDTIRIYSAERETGEMVIARALKRGKSARNCRRETAYISRRAARTLW